MQRPLHAICIIVNNFMFTVGEGLNLFLFLNVDQWPFYAILFILMHGDMAEVSGENLYSLECKVAICICVYEQPYSIYASQVYLSLQLEHTYDGIHTGWWFYYLYSVSLLGGNESWKKMLVMMRKTGHI